VTEGDPLFVLVVSLRVKPDKDREFLAAIEANAAASRRDERRAAAECLDEQTNLATTLVFSGDLDTPRP
jgi:hypothetical protein